MFEYMTRAMVARKEFTYAERDLVPGDPFMATPVDADYLVRCHRADDAPATLVAPVVAPVAAPVVTAQQEAQADVAATEQPRRRGRPSKSAVWTTAMRTDIAGGVLMIGEGDAEPAPAAEGGEPEQPANEGSAA